MIKKVKNTVPWQYVISDLKGKEIVGTFYGKELQKKKKKIKKSLEMKSKKEKIFKLYVKWKGYRHLTVGLIKQT